MSQTWEEKGGKKKTQSEREKEGLSKTIGNLSGARLVFLVPRCPSSWGFISS